MSGRYLLGEFSRYKIGTFAHIAHRNAILYPEREAFKYGAESITFAQFDARVNSLINALHAMGVKKGDGIGVLSWNCLEYVDAYGAAWKGGFVISPLNARWKADEVEYVINDSEINTLFVGPELVEMINSLRSHFPKVKNYISFEGPAPNMASHRDLLDSFPKNDPYVQVEEDDLVIIFYTSGTTGLPKGSLYDHRSRVDQTSTYVTARALGPGHKAMLVLPLFHAGGASCFEGLFYAGAPQLIMKTFEPVSALQTLQDAKIVFTAFVPTQIIALLSVPNVENYNFSSLKHITYGGSPIPVEVLKKALKLWGPVFFQVFGQAESGPDVCVLPSEDHNVLYKPPEEHRKLGSVGQPIMGVQVRIVDDNGKDVGIDQPGEIIIRSKHNMIGYWHKPDETRKALIDGWLHTADIGCYDEKGYIYIVDRKNDVIRSGGEFVFPREVEEILYKHPAVLEATVIGIPDPRWIQRVHAVVVLKQGESVTGDELIALCKKYIAGYKAPKSVEFVDSLPKNPGGKIMKRELRKKYWEGTGRQV